MKCDFNVLSKKMKKQTLTLSDRLFPYLLAVVASVALAWGCYNLFNACRCIMWPTVQGTVLSSEVYSREHRTDNTRTTALYGCDIQYEYIVENTRYSASRYSFSDKDSGDKLYADTLLKQCPVGSTVAVYYHPDNPELAVLDTTLEPVLLVPFIFSLVMFGGAGGVFVFNRKKVGGRASRKRPSKMPKRKDCDYFLMIDGRKQGVVHAIGVSCFMIIFVGLFVVFVASEIPKPILYATYALCILVYGGIVKSVIPQIIHGGTLLIAIKDRKLQVIATSEAMGTSYTIDADDIVQIDDRVEMERQIVVLHTRDESDYLLTQNMAIDADNIVTILTELNPQIVIRKHNR